MKLAIIIPDGCADESQPSLGNRTPLQASYTPNIDKLVSLGHVGQANNVPATLTPASDVATLSLLGYDPLKYYTGRSPLEVVARNIKLGANDWAIRCNLVHIADGKMRDFTAGHINSEEALELVKALAANFNNSQWELHPGVSYRNQLVHRGTSEALFDGTTKTQPPHDIPDQPIEPHLPTGKGSEILRDFIERSKAILKDHPINKERVKQGKLPATQVWLWGQGKAPSLPLFQERFGKKGAILSGVDLVRGVGMLLGWKNIEVPGMTDYLDNDYASQGQAAIETLKHYDVVCVHIEAPDEASHEGKVLEKVKSLELIDKHIVGPIHEAIRSYGAWRMLISPDHPTPVRTRAHSHGNVPFLLAGSEVPLGKQQTYDEATAALSSFKFDPGCGLMEKILSN